MTTVTLKEDFVKAVENLEEQRSMELAEQLKDSGCSAMDIVDLMLLGMKLVGLRYEGGEYFIADLIMAGIIFRSILDLDDVPETSIKIHNPDNPCVVVGTVEGDLHDIGKDIFISLLEARGVNTIDLGVDVPPDRFVDSIRTYAPAVVVLSGTMTVAAESMRQTIVRITECGLREQVRIVVGGSAIHQDMVTQLGADAYSADLVSGSALCQRWVDEARVQ